MKVIFRLNQEGQYLAFFLKAGELTYYRTDRENTCSSQFFHKSLRLTDLHRTSCRFEAFLAEVRQTYGPLEIKHSLEKLSDG